MKQAGIDAIEANETHYTPVPEPSRAEGHRRQVHETTAYTMDQVVVSTGAKQSLANVVLSLSIQETRSSFLLHTGSATRKLSRSLVACCCCQPALTTTTKSNLENLRRPSRPRRVS